MVTTDSSRLYAAVVSVALVLSMTVLLVLHAVPAGDEKLVWSVYTGVFMWWIKAPGDRETGR